MWDRPHYRNGSWGEDSVKNMRNLCIPGTGIPLSWLAMHKDIALVFLWCIYPIVCLVAAVYCYLPRGLAAVAQGFETNLLQPDDWFSFWRLNCRLASAHAHLMPATGYAMENKWTFLVAAKAAGIPVSPWLEAPAALVAKDRNEEGGMGIHFFKNAAHGGEWILQPRLHNSAFLRGLLPPSAPLSTLRIITSSTAGLRRDCIRRVAYTGEQPLEGGALQEARRHITALSCVFRAGRAEAETDHSCILFDVDLATGLVGGGTTNAHWYRLWQLGGADLNSKHDYQVHPDGGAPVTGAVIPDMQGITDMVVGAHAELLADVPLAGWDVALTPEGPLLLEVNLSCNFFRGSFDAREYWSFVRAYMCQLDKARRRAWEQ